MATQKRCRPTHAVRDENLPEPSAIEKERWGPLATKCMGAVLANNGPRQYIKEKVRMYIPNNWPYKDWPYGITLKRYEEGRLIEYNAEYILLWLYKRKLCDYTPGMLYKNSKGVRSMLFKLEGTTEKLLDKYGMEKFLTFEKEIE